MLLTIEGCPLKDRITNDVTAAVQPLDGVERVDVRLTPMSQQQREGLVSTLRGGAPTPQQKIQFPPSTSVIAVASGKGGVGKSSVTVNLAAAMAAEGKKVGILDADVWGFSVPRMLGVSGKPVGFENMILPLEGYGVKVISMGFFVPDDTPGDLARARCCTRRSSSSSATSTGATSTSCSATCRRAPATSRSRSRRSCRAPRCSSSPPRRKPRAPWPSAPARWPSARTCARSAWSRT